MLPSLILALHLVWILFVIFGAAWTRGRPVWTSLHIAALVWGILTEAGPWPCPLTLAEEYCEARAGLHPHHGSFLAHLLDSIVYPNLPYAVVTAVGVSVCALSLGIYGWRLRTWLRAKQARAAGAD